MLSLRRIVQAILEQFALFDELFILRPAAGRAR